MSRIIMDYLQYAMPMSNLGPQVQNCKAMQHLITSCRCIGFDATTKEIHRLCLSALVVLPSRFRLARFMSVQSWMMTLPSAGETTDLDS